MNHQWNERTAQCTVCGISAIEAGMQSHPFCNGPRHPQGRDVDLSVNLGCPTPKVIPESCVILESCLHSYSGRVKFNGTNTYVECEICGKKKQV